MHPQTTPFVRSQRCCHPLPSAKKRDICWLFSRITWYIKQNCSLADAIDFAIDDCLMEGIRYSLFMRHRTEIKEQILRTASSVLITNPNPRVFL